MRSFLTFVRFDNDPNRPLSRDEHRRWRILGLFYLCLWLAVAVILFCFVSWPNPLKWLITLVLIIGTPALSDLWESYDNYLVRRKVRSSAKGPNRQG
jgi:hypothetical protein